MSRTPYLDLNIPDKSSKGFVVTDVFEPNFTKLDQEAERVNLRKMSTEDNIEELKKATRYKEGDVVEVLGYYTKGDGGGHQRQKRPVGYTGTDAVIGADGSIWGIVFLNNIVNPLHFGAKNNYNSTTMDISVNSTESFNNMFRFISSLKASRQEKYTVYIPSGNYLVSHIDVPSGGNNTISTINGDGKWGTRIFFYNPKGVGINYEGEAVIWNNIGFVGWKSDKNIPQNDCLDVIIDSNNSSWLGQDHFFRGCSFEGANIINKCRGMGSSFDICTFGSVYNSVIMVSESQGSQDFGYRRYSINSCEFDYTSRAFSTENPTTFTDPINFTFTNNKGIIYNEIIQGSIRYANVVGNNIFNIENRLGAFYGKMEFINLTGNIFSGDVRFGQNGLMDGILINSQVSADSISVSNNIINNINNKLLESRVGIKNLLVNENIINGCSNDSIGDNIFQMCIFRNCSVYNLEISSNKLQAKDTITEIPLITSYDSTFDKVSTFSNGCNKELYVQKIVTGGTIKTDYSSLFNGFAIEKGRTILSRDSKKTITLSKSYSNNNFSIIVNPAYQSSSVFESLYIFEAFKESNDSFSIKGFVLTKNGLEQLNSNLEVEWVVVVNSNKL
ncbi:MAG: hypothetical protein ACRCX2_08365 [Paraclostridium sp.]